MPRQSRVSVVDVVYHVINRANSRSQIFSSSGDYQHFESLLQESKDNCESGHRHFDAVHRVGEDLVVSLDCGRNVAGVERREPVHLYSPIFLSRGFGREREIMRSPH